MLALDFYFSAINLNDFNVSFTIWKNEIKILNNLYKYYLSYLKLVNYNISINIYSFYFILEYVINNN
jgi:hypothetical protein